MNLRLQLANEHSCTGCMACVDACPQDALKSVEANDGHLYASFEEDKCINCKRCEQVCPVLHMPYASNKVDNSKIYAAVSNDDILYEKSTSGGVFATIAKQILEGGGVVVGAKLEGFRTKHIVVDSINELNKLQGSKYMESNLTGIYKTINKYLQLDRKVLFSGMGCQGAAVSNFFRKSSKRNLLFIVDIICGGVPSNLLVDKFKESQFKPDEIHHFREKNKYAFGYLKDGQIESLSISQALPLGGFCAEFTERWSCYDCQFTGIGRASDLTIGDYWGKQPDDMLKKYPGKHFSIVIANSIKANELLQNFKYLQLSSAPWSALRDNPRCVYGKSLKKHSIFRKKLPELFSKYDYRTLNSLYGNGGYCANVLWLVSMFERFVIGKINRILVCYYANKLIKMMTK